MIRLAFILLIGALVALSGDGEARLWHSSGGNPITFTFSYPPPAHLHPINAGEDSFPVTNAFGTFTWTNHQVEDPGPGPPGSPGFHEHYGMWFVTLTPAGGGTPQQFTMPNALGAFAIAQDQTGTVYLEQGDSIWFALLGWQLNASSELTGGPHFLPAGPLQVPTVSGPFTPSPDSMTPITAPVGTLTSVEGIWTWGAADTGTDYFLLLNGATTGFSAHTLTIESNGKAFASQAHTGSNKVFIGYNFNSSGVPTVGPIPIGVSWNPSFYSNQSSCQFAESATCAPIFSRSGGGNTIGHLMNTLTVVMSDGGVFSGSFTLFQIGSPTVPSNPFQLVGNQLQLVRTLTVADDGVTTGSPLWAVVFVNENGVVMNAGWAWANDDVGP